MSVRRFICLASTVAICLQLAVGALQLEGLSRAAESPEKPGEPPQKAGETGQKDAPSESLKDAAKDAVAKVAQQQIEDDFELLELFADTLDQVERNYVKDVTRRQLMEAAIRGMLSELDPFSNFIPPKQLDRFKVEVENEFGGVGIQVSFDNGQLRVISPLVGTPAYRAGVMSGDLITEIEGESTKGITLDEAVQRMKGLVGTKVKLKVLHAGAMEPEAIELERENIRVETVLGDTRNADDAWRWLVDQEQGIGYVRVTGFGRHTAEDLQRALKQLADQNVRGLILDLRFNPGGLLSSAIEVSDLFVATGRIVSTEGRNVEPRSWDAQEKGTFAGFPMAVLVNRYSASASEIVAACLQDHDRAVIIGERTWGKGSVQNVIEMEGGASALKLTTAGYHRPNGKNIHKFPGAKDSDDWGVNPNSGFEVKLSGKEMTQLMEQQRRAKDIVRKSNGEAKPEAAAGDGFVDLQLQKALDYIKAQLEARKKMTNDEKPNDEGMPKSE
jgi:carboxyl-terminal processing protease